MARLFYNRITLVWLGLVLATLFSWETRGDLAHASDARNLGTLVLVIAFVKARYIILEFMELRRAPLVMRLFAEVWAVLVCAAVIAFYWGIGMPGPPVGQAGVRASRPAFQAMAGDAGNQRRTRND